MKFVFFSNGNIIHWTVFNHYVYLYAQSQRALQRFCLSMDIRITDMSHGFQDHPGRTFAGYLSSSFVPSHKTALNIFQPLGTLSKSWIFENQGWFVLADCRCLANVLLWCREAKTPSHFFKNMSKPPKVPWHQHPGCLAPVRPTQQHVLQATYPFENGVRIRLNWSKVWLHEEAPAESVLDNDRSGWLWWRCEESNCIIGLIIHSHDLFCDTSSPKQVRWERDQVGLCSLPLPATDFVERPRRISSATEPRNTAVEVWCFVLGLDAW